MMGLVYMMIGLIYDESHIYDGSRIYDDGSDI